MNDKNTSPADDFAAALHGVLGRRTEPDTDEPPPTPRAPRPDYSQGSSATSRPVEQNPAADFAAALNGHMYYNRANGRDTFYG
jgi:hypothetical protein